MKILVVEEEPFVALAVVWELERAGHEVIGPVAHARDALAVCGHQKPELALIDIDEGYEHDGLELARRLQAQADIPSLYLTGDPQLARSNRDAALGAITKPFDPEDLVRGIEVFLARMNGEEPPPDALPPSMEVFQ
jgi:DNA-binding response OmpR family regulator